MNEDKSFIQKITELPTSIQLPTDSLTPENPAPSLKQEIGQALTVLFESEQWPIFQTFLDKWYSDYAESPEAYANNPDLAKFDSGIRHLITCINNLKSDAVSCVDFYAKSNGSGAQTPSQ